jgi:protein-S-isoprenylcysteine O-methyltransferase Ste14
MDMVETTVPNPIASAIRRSAISFAIAAVLIVAPSGTLADPVGWAAWAVITVSSSLVTVDLARRDPALLARRLSGGPTAERTPIQKAIQAVAGAALIGAVIVAGLDRRFGWSSPPVAAIVAGDLALALSQLGFLAVFRANSFAGATVTVEADQRLISTGPYAIVRHPMYAAMLPFLIGLGPALGSWWALLAAPVVIAALVARLLDEERVLVRDLPGYAAYRERVRFRLVPGVW